MKNKSLFQVFILVLSLWCIGACTSSYESTSQLDDSKAFILLTGNFQGASLKINEGETIVLGDDIATFKLDGKEVAKFEVNSGTNKIHIYKGGVLVVYRQVYVTFGNQVEVPVQ